jgi:hypothetical protein
MTKHWLEQNSYSYSIKSIFFPPYINRFQKLKPPYWVITQSQFEYLVNTCSYSLYATSSWDEYTWQVLFLCSMNCTQAFEITMEKIRCCPLYLEVKYMLCPLPPLSKYSSVPYTWVTTTHFSRSFSHGQLFHISVFSRNITSINSSNLN